MLKDIKDFFKIKNQPKLLLTIDWLTINVEDVFKVLEFDKSCIMQVGDIKLELIPNQRTKNFNKCLRLWHCDRHVATVAYDSNSAVILKGRAHITFQNHLFYSGMICATSKIIVENFSIKDVRISRLDIACDGVFLHPFVNYFYSYGTDKNMVSRPLTNLSTHENTESESLQAGRECDIHCFNNPDNIVPLNQSRADRYNRVFDSFHVGSLGNKHTGKSRSERFCRYYNKTKELSEMGHKQYINEYFKANGFDMSVDTYRFEVQLASSYVAKLAFFEWHYIFDSVALEMLFVGSLDNFFAFAFNDYAHTSRKTKICLFEGFAKSVFVRADREVRDNKRTYKIMVNRLIKDAMRSSRHDFGEDFDDYLVKNMVRKLLFHNSLYVWFDVVFPMLCERIIKEAYLNGYNVSERFTNKNYWL